MAVMASFWKGGSAPVQVGEGRALEYSVRGMDKEWTRIRSEAEESRSVIREFSVKNISTSCFASSRLESALACRLVFVYRQPPIGPVGWFPEQAESPISSALVDNDSHFSSSPCDHIVPSLLYRLGG